MASAESTSPKWPSLERFCSECFYTTVCPLTTLAEVENCGFVRDQRALDLAGTAHGRDRLLAPTPLTYGNTIIRDRKAPRGTSKKAQFAAEPKPRGRRPLDEVGVRWLTAAILSDRNLDVEHSATAKTVRVMRVAAPVVS